ncbi:uncharacterized protein LOC6563243 [Drosophila grimshawi]|uniref:GH17221 n=1 Tax=Drosophila grimshawi TaxID=7222 RepID=B4JG84_DROGR|nr:uncharacterized protein LOC6563243 [Drosophila grimshawi]EDV93651.1 GH17221 [Drosophila grimshawi]
MCGYKPLPANYNSWLAPLHAERLKRLGEKLLVLKLKMKKRPMIIGLHLFADDVDGLRHWVELLYQIAAPHSYGEKITFFVDDLWAAYAFDLNGFSLWRGHTSFSIQSPPLIFGISAAGKVHFLGSAKGPKTPCLENLQAFCDQLLTESIEQELGFEDWLPVPDVDLSNFNELIYGEQADLVICFYNSQELDMDETREFLDDLCRLAAKLQNEQVKIFKMNVHKSLPPKKFPIKSFPSMFLLPRHRKQSPIRCHYPRQRIESMLKAVAQHSSEELNFYDRHTLRKLHVDLLVHIRNYLKEENYELVKRYIFSSE